MRIERFSSSFIISVCPSSVKVADWAFVEETSQSKPDGEARKPYSALQTVLTSPVMESMT